MIPFNKTYKTGKEIEYIKDVISTGKLSGNGVYTQRCQQFFEEKYHIKKALLVTSCTDALEMCSMLANIQPGDEVIVPSYTFVSSALAFVRDGAHIVFADSYREHPNMDVQQLEALLTPKTKAIVVVHYAGMACDMDAIMDLAYKHNLIVIEDAAQAIDSYYFAKDGSKQALGTIGHLGAFSFHETKNIISGEGGLLTINDERFVKRAEILWEKGTNRSEFFRGEINKYGWVDKGSSFLTSELIAAFLWAQLEQLDDIQSKRIALYNYYQAKFEQLANEHITLPLIPTHAMQNGHMYYIVLPSLEVRNKVIAQLKEEKIYAVFHYLSLHESDYYKPRHDGRALVSSDRFTDCLLRLPMFYELTFEEIDTVVAVIEKSL